MISHSYIISKIQLVLGEEDFNKIKENYLDNIVSFFRYLKFIIKLMNQTVF